MGGPLSFPLLHASCSKNDIFFFSLFPCCMLIAGKRGQWGFLSPLCPMLLQLAGTVDVYLFYATLCNQFFEVLLPFIKTRWVLLCYPSHNLIWLNRLEYWNKFVKKKFSTRIALRASPGHPFLYLKSACRHWSTFQTQPEFGFASVKKNRPPSIVRNISKY